MRRIISLAGLGIAVCSAFLAYRQLDRISNSASDSSPFRLELPSEPDGPILATYPDTFRCTLYYTPQESGFTREGGFDMEPETRLGLNERKYPREFLRAVKQEGFGRLKEPVQGMSYLRYWSNQWGFIERPVDYRNRPLIARESCAVSKPFDKVQPEARLRIFCPNLPPHFNNLRWRVKDTGSGLQDRQLDLYWGEDDPLGPGNRVSRPKGFDHDVINPTVMVMSTNAR